MVGFITWRVIKETELGLARSADILEVRPPASETEKGREEKEMTNPFGPLAAASIVLLLLGNLAVTGRENNFAFVAVAVAFAVIAVATAVATAVVVAVVADDIRLYRVFSGVSGILMVVAVLVAI